MKELEQTIELKLVDFMKIHLEFPNDGDLGKKCRNLFDTTLVNKLIPNDTTLGIYTRNFLKKIQK
jgi:hypothetical protein